MKSKLEINAVLLFNFGYDYKKIIANKIKWKEIIVNNHEIMVDDDCYYNRWCVNVEINELILALINTNLIHDSNLFWFYYIMNVNEKRN